MVEELIVPVDDSVCMVVYRYIEAEVVEDVNILDVVKIRDDGKAELYPNGVASSGQLNTHQVCNGYLTTQSAKAGDIVKLTYNAIINGYKIETEHLGEYVSFVNNSHRLNVCVNLNGYSNSCGFVFEDANGNRKVYIGTNVN